MKQKLLYSIRLRIALLVALLCSLGTGSVWATDNQITITRSSFTDASTGYGTYSWTSGVSGKGQIYGTNADEMQMNGGNANGKYIYNTTAINGKIKSISIKRSSSGSDRAYIVYVGSSAYNGTSDLSTSLGSKTVTTSGVTYSVTSGSYDYFEIANNTSKACYISEIVITYEDAGPAKTPCVDASTITLEPGGFDIKGNRTGTFVASGTKTDAGATFSYSTSATSGLTVAADGSYTASAAGDYTIKVTATPSNTETYSSVEKDFDITLTDTRDACGLAYTPSSYEANLGESFTTPTLTNPHSLSVTYSSSRPSVATVNSATGAVTMLKDGEVTVTATAEGTNDYKGGTASYTLTITDPNKKVFDFTGTEDYGSNLVPKNSSSSPSYGSTEYETSDATWTNDGVTLVSSGKYRWWKANSNNDLRFYSNNPQSKMTISAPTGKVITNITITGGQAWSCNVGSYSEGKWNGQEKSVVLTYNAASGNVAVKTVSVTIGDPTVTVGSALYTTYTTLIPVSFAGVTAYTVSSISGSSVSLTEVTEAPANTPVIIKAAAADTYTLTYKSDAASVGTNLLQASDGTVTGDGVDSDADGIGEGTIYALGVGKADPYVGVVGFYLVNNGQTVPAGKAYLEVTAPGVKGFTFDFDGVATGVNAIAKGQEATANGQIFNLAGQRVNKAQKGLYIMNGKKVLVK